ncbi:MAG: alpha/beta hydrolase fold domain-containing protein [Desulfovibrio sp.]|nr:alpha/beta hydrolase fold domain-containing protein [Desulfovibrio sp.]
MSRTFRHLTVNDTVRDIVCHPAFAHFGKHLLPRSDYVNNTTPIRDIARLLPLHRHVQADVVLRALNQMIDICAAGELLFHSYYDDHRRNITGLFFFRGKPNAPFAVICPGGGFVYLGTLHEGFPLALEIQQKGYNVFVLQYRVGGEHSACEDLAMALSWIFQHAETLNISSQCYSLWGGSAGARMAAIMGTAGTTAFGGKDIPHPASVITAYTAYQTCSPYDPPTFAVIGDKDHIVTIDVMKKRIQLLTTYGIDAAIHLYEQVGHGFGTGEGTPAAGWINDAVRFWEKHIHFRASNR